MYMKEYNDRVLKIIAHRWDRMVAPHCQCISSEQGMSRKHQSKFAVQNDAQYLVF